MKYQLLTFLPKYQSTIRSFWTLIQIYHFCPDFNFVFLSMVSFFKENNGRNEQKDEKK